MTTERTEFSTPCDEIVAAIRTIRNECGLIRKDKTTTTGPKFAFASFEGAIEQVEAIIAKQKAVLTATVVDSCDLPPRETQGGGKMFRYRVKVRTTLTMPSGQWASVISVGDGEDSTDKAPYKAQTGARKYGLYGLFDLATSDDPEHGSAAQPAARPQPAQRPHTQTASRPAPSGGGSLPPQGTRTFIVYDLSVYEGTGKGVNGKNGKPYTKFTIACCENGGNGEEVKMTTFSQAHADIAQGCIETGCPAQITFQFNPQYKSYNLTDIAAVNPDDADAPPAEQEPEGQLSEEESPF